MSDQSVITPPVAGRLAAVPAVLRELRPARTPLRIAAAASVLSGLIHFAVVPEHRAEFTGYAVFFTVVAIAELVWAAAVWTGAEGWLVALGVVANVAIIALWAVTRTAGLPFGPEPGVAESIGLADVVCCVGEAVTVVAGTAALWFRWARAD